MDLGLTGRVAMVAGASSGLGLAVAERLALEGCDVAICGRDPDRLADAARRVEAAGKGRVLSRVVDVRSDAEVAQWVAVTVREMGALHIVVTNGAGPPPGPVEAFGPADYRDALDTSLLPHIALVLAALPHLRAAGWGRILMVASETVRQPIPRYGLSNTARPGLLGFAKSLVDSLGPGDVTVNVLAPGYHRTPALERQFGDEADRRIAEIAKGIPLGRVGDPADFAAVAAFLASRPAGFVTGTVQLVDGGATKGIP
ncbi:SDR family NAD(P)-dependent oxidoreductase [Thermomonospora amylolytica]|uniref:SDR family NAD(P)-dependent oxidoreductase n=1 Tax=Thermomonospora amylolytica TaxID=1411117 RepID=UPI000E6B7811|nr:SDR family oxidoreductase [Thermomonospora amylolytica]